ncbi:RNA 3'-terminal phosphate cyclase [Lycorma delicatula]|uniref:RNA 3'-terminal phosphate cyclase n=1 Tax=Lycorma delicatula TaxID=130591 RepID=UPI003F51904F
MNIKIMCEFVVLSAMEIHLRCTWSVNLCVVVLCVVFYNVIQNSIKMSDLLDIDGSVLEGGGQILRLAATLSVLQQIPIRVRNIRAGRSKPGLRPQHLKGLEIARDICQGNLENAVENSVEVSFYPGQLTSGSYIGDTKTAGSICLMVQVALPCALFSSGQTTLQLLGGTNADMAPPIDHTVTVFKSVLKRFGGSFDHQLVRRGFYPKGGGEVKITVTPVKSLKSVNMTDGGSVQQIWGVSYVAGSGEFLMKIMEKMASSAEQRLRPIVPGIPLNIKRVKEKPEDAVGIGTGICIFAETSTGCVLGGTALGKRGVPAEDVGRAAADELIESINFHSCVDQHTQDQIIILMALAEGKSSVKCGPITLHTETAIHVAQLLTKAKFTIKEEGPKSNIIECEGIGRTNNLI